MGHRSVRTQAILANERAEAFEKFLEFLEPDFQKTASSDPEEAVNDLISPCRHSVMAVLI